MSNRSENLVNALRVAAPSLVAHQTAAFVEAVNAANGGAVRRPRGAAFEFTEDHPSGIPKGSVGIYVGCHAYAVGDKVIDAEFTRKCTVPADPAKAAEAVANLSPRSLNHILKDVGDQLAAAEAEYEHEYQGSQQ